MLKVLIKLLPNSFRGRIIIIIVALGILAAIANLAIAGYYEYTFLKRNINAAVTNQFQAVSKIFTEAVAYDNIYDLFTRAEAMVQFLDFVENIYIFDGHGEYLTDAAVAKDIPNIDSIGSRSHKMYLLEAGTERVGYVVYTMDAGYIPHTLITHLSGLAAFGLLLLTLGVAFGTAISSFLTKPLIELSSQINTLDSLPMRITLPDHSPDEVKLLAETLNSLSASLEEAIDKVKEQDKAIARSDKLASVGTMAAGLAHQLKNPIMSIELLTHCMQSNPNSEDLVVIQSEVEHINRILNEFLELSKPISLVLVEFSCGDLCKQLSQFVSARFKQLSFTFNVSYEGFIFADMQKLYDIMINIVNNSVEAGATELTVSITTTTNGKVMFILQDNGKGIPPQRIPYIFHPFYTSKSTGTGLGLAYSEMIITAMGGEISLYSNIVDSGGNTPTGVSFKLTLPIYYSKV